MARKVTNMSNSVDSYSQLSQTPKNYDKNNFFIKELQDKVDAEWPYRFNRVDVEFEQTWGEEDYTPLEVVVQTVKKDTVQAFAVDTRRLVFKDIREDRFTNGSKFRFTPDYRPNMNADTKDVWLVTNFQNIRATTSAVITRCNGTLASLYTDSQNISRIHYEPSIQTIDLTAVNLFYNETAVSPQSGFVGLVQHNKYTRNYYINQRFIIGYDKVYRVKALDKFYGLTTNDPTNVGLMKIYFEITEESAYDDFTTRVAYQMEPIVKMVTSTDSGNYSVRVVEPDFIPTDLTSTPITFQVYAHQDELPLDIPISISTSLTNWPDNVSLDKQDLYYSLETKDDGHTFTLARKKLYSNGELEIVCSVTKENSPTGEEFSTMFKLVMRGLG